MTKYKDIIASFQVGNEGSVFFRGGTLPKREALSTHRDPRTAGPVKWKEENCQTGADVVMLAHGIHKYSGFCARHLFEKGHHQGHGR